MRTKLNLMAHGLMRIPSMPDMLTPKQIGEQTLDTEAKWKMYNESFLIGKANKCLPEDILAALEYKLSSGIAEKKKRKTLWQKIRRLF